MQEPAWLFKLKGDLLKGCILERLRHPVSLPKSHHGNWFVNYTVVPATGDITAAAP